MYVDVFRDDRRSMNKIVYVEDEPEVGQLIAAYLGKHDIEVVVEPRGDRAEDVVTREPGAAGHYAARKRWHDALPGSAREVGRPDRAADLSRQRYESYSVP